MRGDKVRKGDTIQYRGEPALVVQAWQRLEDCPNGLHRPVGVQLELNYKPPANEPVAPPPPAPKLSVVTRVWRWMRSVGVKPVKVPPPPEPPAPPRIWLLWPILSVEEGKLIPRARRNKMDLSALHELCEEHLEQFPIESL